MSEKLKVGDRLWLVEKSHRDVRQSPVIVTKVGRKWATIFTDGAPGYEKPRIGIDDLVCDGGDYCSPGRCFRSQEEYEDRMRLAEAWDELQKMMRDRWYRRPEHITLADIQQINAMLSARQETRHGE